MYIIRYLALRLKTLKGMTIVHVGAHRGQEAEQYQRWGARRVIWVEADPNLLGPLQAHLDKVRALPQGLLARVTGAPKTEHVVVHALVGDRDGVETELHLFDNDGASNSMFRKSTGGEDLFPGVNMTGQTVTLKMQRLDSLLEAAGVAPESVDFLAMDIQGAELLCLKGAPRTLAGLRYLETEVTTSKFYEGGVLAGELDAWLGDRGFRRHTRLRRPMMNAVYVAASPGWAAATDPAPDTSRRNN